MIFRETELSGAFIIEVQRLEDDRGFFGELDFSIVKTPQMLSDPAPERPATRPARPEPWRRARNHLRPE